MPGKKYPTDILEQAVEVHEAWNRIDKDLKYGTANLGARATDIAQLRNLEHTLSNLEVHLTETRNRRETVCLEAWDKIKRARAGIKATFGDDSTQYEMMGGKRLSDRKPVRRSPSPEQ